MKSKNALRVAKFRKSKGNGFQKNKYHKLRSKYGIDVSQANKMKFWSVDRIKQYLKDNNIKPTEEYLNSLEEADKL